MGINNGGPGGPSIGKNKNYVSYFRMGQYITRTIGEITSWTEPQYENQMRMGLTTAFLKPVKQFTDVGFRYCPKPKSTWGAYTMALSLNRKAITTGIYPDLDIDFSKAILSMGDLPVPKNAEVNLTDSIIKFSWSAELEHAKADESDRVMCVAYFPENGQALTVLSGAKRTEEEQTIVLPSFTEEMVIETYICYISEDRKRVSNSVYTGQLHWSKS